MLTKYTAFFLLIHTVLIFSFPSFAQDWKPMGPENVYNLAPSCGLAASKIDNSHYSYIYNDEKNLIIVKMFKNDELYNIDTIPLKGLPNYQIALSVSNSGILHIAYFDYGEEINKRFNLLKYINNKWVKIDYQLRSQYISSIDIQFSPVTDFLYLLYSTPSEGTVLKTYTGTEWLSSQISINQLTLPKMGISKKDEVYILTPEAYDGAYSKLVLMKRENNIWQKIETNNIVQQSFLGMDFEISPSGIPYVIYPNNVGGGVVAVVIKLINQNWQNVGDIIPSALSESGEHHLNIAIDQNDIPYISFLADYDYGLRCYRFIDNWEYIKGVTKDNGFSLDMVLDNVGYPIIGFTHPGLRYRDVIFRYNGEEWYEPVPSSISSHYANSLDMIVTKEGISYIAYSIEDKIVIKRFIEGEWEQVFTVVKASNPKNIEFTFSDNGQFYLAYLEEFLDDKGYRLINKPVIKVYEEDKWKTLESVGLSQGDCTDLSLEIAPDGTPYISYIDINSSLGFVKKFNGVEWSNPAQLDLINKISLLKLKISNDNIPHIIYKEGRNIIVQKLEDTKWKPIGLAEENGEYVSGDLHLRFNQENKPIICYPSGYIIVIKEYKDNRWNYLNRDFRINTSEFHPYRLVTAMSVSPKGRIIVISGSFVYEYFEGIWTQFQEKIPAHVTPTGNFCLETDKNENNFFSYTTSGGIYAIHTGNINNNIYQILPNKIRLMSSGNSCIGTSDGKLVLKIDDDLVYQARLTNESYNYYMVFKDSTSIENLNAGIYKLTISPKEYPLSQLVYTIKISEPEPLSVYSISKEGNLKLKLQGGENYFISLNGTEFKTNEKEFTLPLHTGSNFLKVKTDKSCQGEYSEKFFMNENVDIYPNPFINHLNISDTADNIGEIVKIELFDTSGKKVFETSTKKHTNILTVDLPEIQSGAYILVKKEGNSTISKKIVKR